MRGVVGGLVGVVMASACARSTPQTAPVLPEAVVGDPGDDPEAVEDVKVTVLSDDVASEGTLREWGFAAFVEIRTGGKATNILFDTGASGQLVQNAAALGVDLCSAEDVVLSHNHRDHTRGLVSVREHCRSRNPNAVRRAHVGGPEIFWPRTTPTGVEDNPMGEVRAAYEAVGGTFVTAETVTPLGGLRGVWTSGKIARLHDEGVHPTAIPLTTPTGERVMDRIPEEHALVVATKQGLVVLTGCAHAGTTNTLEHVRAATKRPHVHAVVGGLHLFRKPVGTTSEVGTLAWQASQLSRMKPHLLLGAHCTGPETVAYLRAQLGLAPEDTAIGVIGARLTMAGLVPGVPMPSP